MKHRLNKEKLDQAARYLDREGIDLWLILSTEGSDPCLPLIVEEYVSGASAFIVTRTGETIALVSPIDGAGLVAGGAYQRVIQYPLSIDETLKQLMAELNPAQVALNFSSTDGLCDGLTLGKYLWLKDLMGEAFIDRCVSSEKVLKRLRSIKTPEEIQRIRQAVKTTTDIYARIFPQLRPGLSEKEISALFVDEMIACRAISGLDKALSGPMVLKERMTHRLPDDAILEPGDFLVMDFSIDHQGYTSDIARTAYFLKPGETAAPESMQAAFDTALGAIDAALATIRPGVKGYEVDAAARQFIVDTGFPEIRHATGHQIGRRCHDGGTTLAPRWDRYRDAPYGALEAGMLFAVEPSVLQDDGPCVIVEENVLVTEQGVTVLSDRQRDLVLVPSA